jgi:MFS family permease
MNSDQSMTNPLSTDAPREDWLRAGILAGFLGTFAMTVVLVAAYWLASSIGSAAGGVIQRWSWALVNNPVAQRTADGVVLAIGANLAVGLLLALVYARYAEPRLHGSSLWRGMQFALIPWLLSLVVFLPVMGGGVLGMGVGAGPLPILGNLILHLVYGAVLGISYAEATEDWLDDTDIDRDNAAAAERGAAFGLIAGLIPGFVLGWFVAPAFDDLVGRPATAIGVAFIGAAIGLAIGSFAGMGRGQGPARGSVVRR